MSFADIITRLRLNGEDFSRELRRRMGGVDDEMRRVGARVNAISRQMGVAMGAVLTAGAGVAARQGMEIADAYKSLEAQLRLATQQSGSFARAQEDVNRIAEATRSGISDVGKLYGAFMRTSRELGISQEQAARATQTVTQAFIISGSGAEEAANGTRQLMQAFQSGVLRGDEFNSMAENAPRLQRLLADSLGTTVGRLRVMAEAGQLTADKLTRAFTDQRFTAALDAEFRAMPVTFGQAMTLIHNSAQVTFGAFDQGGQFSQALTNFFATGADGMRGMEDRAEEMGIHIRGTMDGIATAWDGFGDAGLDQFRTLEEQFRASALEMAAIIDTLKNGWADARDYWRQAGTPGQQLPGSILPVPMGPLVDAVRPRRRLIPGDELTAEQERQIGTGEFWGGGRRRSNEYGEMLRGIDESERRLRIIQRTRRQGGTSRNGQDFGDPAYLRHLNEPDRYDIFGNPIGPQRRPAAGSSSTARGRAREAERTAAQAFADFERELAREGIRRNAGRTGIRSTADQRDIYNQLGPGRAAAPGRSLHERARAIDLPMGVDQEAVRRAAARAGILGLRPRPHHGVMHTEWAGHTGGRVDAARGREAYLRDQDRLAEESQRNAERALEVRQRIVEAGREAAEQAALDVRTGAMRLRGLEQQAELAQRLARIERSHAEAMAQLTPEHREEQGRITAGLGAQIAAYERQAGVFAGLLEQNGDREEMSAAQAAAEEQAAAAMADALDIAARTGATLADNKAIQEAAARVEAQLNSARERGVALEERRAGIAEKEMQAREEAEREWNEEKAERYEEEQQRIADLADFYEQVFSGRVDDIWEGFKETGLRVIAEVAARWTLAQISGQPAGIGSILGQVTGPGGGFGNTLVGTLVNALGIGGGAGKGAGDGKLGAVASMLGGGATGGFNVLSMLGLGGSASGAAGGGLMASLGLGSAAGPIGLGLTAAALLAPSILSRLNPKKGSATLSLSGGELGFAATGKQAQAQAAGGAARSVIDTLERIAASLGGTLSGSPSVSIGQRGDRWRVDPLGRGQTKAKGVLDFADQESAVRAAIADALKDGVIGGISDAAKKILQSGQDFERALDKAMMIEDIPRKLKERMDPVGAALDALAKKWKAINAALDEGGASAEQRAAAEKLYRIELAETKEQAGEASATLKAFRDSFMMGSSSPYALTAQQEAAAKALQPYLDQIGRGERVDQAKYQSAASTYLDIQRAMYGSTERYFEELDRIQAATGKAIETIDGVAPIRSVSDAFNEQTAANTRTMTEQLDQLTAQVAALRGELAGGGSGGAAHFVGGGRGFSAIQSA